MVSPGWLQGGGRLCEEWPRGKTPVVVGSLLGWLGGWLVGSFTATRCTQPPTPIVFPFHGTQTRRTSLWNQKQLSNAKKSVKAWSLAWGPAPRRALLRFVSTAHRNNFCACSNVELHSVLRVHNLSRFSILYPWFTVQTSATDLRNEHATDWQT